MQENLNPGSRTKATQPDLLEKRVEKYLLIPIKIIHLESKMVPDQWRGKKSSSHSHEVTMAMNI